DTRLAAIFGEASGLRAEPGGTWTERLRHYGADERREKLFGELKTKLTEFQRSSAGALAVKMEAGQLAIDSLSMVEIVIQINRHFGVELSPGDLLTTTTLDQLADTLLARLTILEKPATAQA